MPVQDAKLLSGILAQGKIAIPEYQREYEWGIDLLKPLWNDLQTCIDEDGNSADYFLGNLMLHDRKAGMSTVWDLVDGQQRLVSITLISAVVRDKLTEMGQHAEAHDVSHPLEARNGKSIPHAEAENKKPSSSSPATIEANHSFQVQKITSHSSSWQ